ncbi:exodeoxyribonuclease V alpha subunit [Desulfonatronum thiosulfatophilum]|uniref:Exodeoxyribonuclease V alpha subunit n=1 Tax=Desulfonatronum thiosulfatophilum TaxID=617002 RepID=A0A1G6E9P1_9BACT|nr:ATP-dependent RecD-like DNA helicase [Desulfonatronum thiosulfatophilum]SDB54189.1 exodeoxyribonuclease V alpha subunit [Desulfonatronum thiosulfatophilum]
MKPQPRSSNPNPLCPPLITINAEVQGVTFFNPANGYAVIRVKVREEPGIVTAVGNIVEVKPGELLNLSGQWKEHPKYGRQFLITKAEPLLPAGVNAIRRYLASGQLKGVGPALAERMIKLFKDKTLEIIDTDPDQLLRVEGIGVSKLQKIVQSWEEQHHVRALILFLQEHDVSPALAVRIHRHYGAQALQKVRDNPYDLAYEVHGIGFKTADAIALKLGFAPYCRERLEAALVYMLFHASESGHVFVPLDELLENTTSLLGGAPLEELHSALDVLAERRRIILEELPTQGLGTVVYLSHFHRWENEIAQRLRELIQHPAAVDKSKLRNVLAQLEARHRITLSPQQRQAVEDACLNKVFILTGGPGTGKTTITRFIVEAVTALGIAVKLAAPTGRAAKRLSEATRTHASTLHRLLQYAPDGGFGMNETKMLKAGMLVVDEVSMLDCHLCLAVLRALPLTSRLVLVGDVNQLPSVGPGNILGDLLKSAALPHAELTHIYRQAQESMIVVNAHRINQGQFPCQSPKPPPEADFYWIEQDDPSRVQAMILQMVCERIPAGYGMDPRLDVQVLTPMHKGEVGTQQLNTLLQERLNPKGREFAVGFRKMRVGDRVLQMRNNYDKEVFNGDLGWISSVNIEDGQAVVEFDGRDVSYELSEMDELSLAYAVSVHKSQGSEYPCVVMPLLTQHFMLLQRNLIYTGLTRARRLAVILGSKKALVIGLKNAKAKNRYTDLARRIVEMVEG